MNLFDLAIAAYIIPSAKVVPTDILVVRGNPKLMGTGIVLNASSWGSSETNSFLFVLHFQFSCCQLYDFKGENILQ